MVTMAPSRVMFQFTHPGRGATTDTLTIIYSIDVSIHAPREGCDTTRATNAHPNRRFNSRTPGGVRHGCTAISLTCIRFQYTHPGRGAT